MRVIWDCKYAWEECRKEKPELSDAFDYLEQYAMDEMMAAKAYLPKDSRLWTLLEKYKTKEDIARNRDDFLIFVSEVLDGSFYRDLWKWSQGQYHFSGFLDNIGLFRHMLTIGVTAKLYRSICVHPAPAVLYFKNSLEKDFMAPFVRHFILPALPLVSSCSLICPEDCDPSEKSFVPVRLLDVIEAPADNAPGLAHVELRQMEANPRVRILIENERVLNRIKNDEYPMINLWLVSTGADFFPDRESFEMEYGQTDELFDRIVYIEEADPSPTLLEVTGTVLTVHQDMEFQSGRECLSGIMECGGLVTNYFTEANDDPQKVEPGWIIHAICFATGSDEEKSIQGGKANEDN